MVDENPAVVALVKSLGLQAHVEGGYFRRTFQADHRDKLQTEYGPRFSMTSIYYLLTERAPVGHWHRNRSDILHFYHRGDPISYYLIHPDGTLQKVVMGPDPEAGHSLQLAVKGGTWKASHLDPAMTLGAGYGLISEAVAPGFEYEDMRLGEREQLLQQFPQHAEQVRAFSQD